MELAHIAGYQIGRALERGATVLSARIANAHLNQRITVEDLAERAHMSARTFARRFAVVTGTTPHRWLTRHRVLLSQELLEEDALTIDEIARRTGFGTGDLLRHHFGSQIGTTPHAYRRTFSLHSNPRKAVP